MQSVSKAELGYVSKVAILDDSVFWELYAAQGRRSSSQGFYYKAWLEMTGNENSDDLNYMVWFDLTKPIFHMVSQNIQILEKKCLPS
jgi:hypothetical protein